MNITLRPGTPEDVEICGRICFDAFTTISNQHRFPQDFPSVDVAIGLIQWCLTKPDVYSVVAEIDGRVVGSNFLWENEPIAGIGPITVDPAVQNASVGRRMMEDVMARVGWPITPARQQDEPAPAAGGGRRFPGVRLVQAAFHMRSLSLYTKLGFDPREPLACMQRASSPAPKITITGRDVRAARPDDLNACSQLCERIYGFARKDELKGAIEQGVGRVVTDTATGRITGYTTSIGFFAHTVGKSNEDIKALIAAAPEIAGPGVLVPIHNADLFRWCLTTAGLRVTQTMTLMSVGLYQEPNGAWLPSILF
jgi:GNAT superfamily N-acetyltransferase